MKTEVTTSGKDELGLRAILQRYADGFWLPDHVPDEQAGAMILDSFKRKIDGQLELMGVIVTKANESR